MTPRQIVTQVNAHCDKGNGIYVSLKGPAGACVRCFRAMLIPILEDYTERAAFVTPDFGQSWLRVTDETTFSDGNWNAPIGNLPMTRRP